MKTSKRLFFIIAGFILTILLFVFLLEIALRLYGAFPKDSKTFIYNEASSYRFRPTLKNINSSGFCDIEHSKKKEGGGKRIIFIGDSFTTINCSSQKWVFAETIESYAHNNGIGIESINMGLPGLGPREYLGLLSQEALSYKPDLIVVMFFVGNDIFQSHPDFRTAVFLNLPSRALTKPWNIGGSMFYFYSYRLMIFVKRIIQEHFSGKSKNGTFTKATYLDIEKERSAIYKSPKNNFTNQSYAASIDLLSKMNNEAKKEGTEFLVVLIPDEIQVNKKLRQTVGEKFKLDYGDYDFAQPQKFLSQQLSNFEISYVDLLPVFIKHDNKKPLYIKQDTHWNTEGMKIAANYSWSILLEKLVK